MDESTHGDPWLTHDHLSELTSENPDILALRAIVEGTMTCVGSEFFQLLCRHLATALNTKYAFVAEFLGDTRVRTLAYWKDAKIVDNVEWDLRGTPCEEVVFGGLCHHPTGVADRFPLDETLVRMGIQSYLGVPLTDGTGATLGHLAVFDDRPMPATPRALFIFHAFALRATSELLRLRAEEKLRLSEERFRDLFEEAPIAYVHEDLESRFISANQSAIRSLGLRPDEVVGFLGKSLVPDTPDAQKRVRDALESIGRGADTSGVVLELRRKDNGDPLWVQWWSRPDPSGKFTRTMFVDITAKVLLEQEQARLRAQNQYLQEEIKSDHNFEEIVGRSAALVGVLDHVRRVAPTDASVLITGETGTGKELIARAIHSASHRHDKPLIKVNCAALPTGLVESELFGHEKGAFSGAIARRIGRFELANGGTLFLDEVGEIPPEVQVKLLRVLQEREFERVGGGEPLKADVRIIAATNRDLKAAASAGTFREDLYYRLNVFPIHLPPLRKRREDIPLLARFLIDRFASKLGKRIDGMSAETAQQLEAYPWPGNVRELENVLERAVILANGVTLTIDLGPAVTQAASEMGDAETPAGAGSLAEVERLHVLRTLVETNWVIEGPAGAARILNLHPNTLRSRLKKLGIRRPGHQKP